MRTRRRLALAVALVLFGAALYELLIALGVIALGRESGDGAPAESWVTLAALVSMLVGVVLALWETARPAGLQLGVVALSATSFVVVRLYTYDPYYAPTLRRMSDGGLVEPGWVFFLLGGAVVVAILGLRWRTEVAFASAMLLIACLLTTLFEDAGH